MQVDSLQGISGTKWLGSTCVLASNTKWLKGTCGLGRPKGISSTKWLESTPDLADSRAFQAPNGWKVPLVGSPKGISGAKWLESTCGLPTRRQRRHKKPQWTSMTPNSPRQSPTRSNEALDLRRPYTNGSHSSCMMSTSQYGSLTQTSPCRLRARTNLFALTFYSTIGGKCR